MSRLADVTAWLRRPRFLAAAAVAATGLFAGAPATALSVATALENAYRDNPTLRAEYRTLRGANEGVAAARSGLRPSVSASGRTGLSQTRSVTDNNASATTAAPRSVAVQVEQPLFDGGRTPAATRRARLQVEAARAAFAVTEQEVLLDAVRSYANVLRDRQVVALRENNVAVLERQLESTRQRLEVGEITQTDVRQTEARLAGGRARLESARSDLAAAEAAFKQRIGLAPPAELAELTGPENLPANRERAVAAALQTNPGIAAAKRRVRAAEAGIDVARAGLLPQLSLEGSVSRAWDQQPTSPRDHSDQLRVTARLDIPLYQGGETHAGVREAKEGVAEQRRRLDQRRRAVRQRTVAAWHEWEAARSAIDSRKAEVAAAESALEGVREEYEVGTQTTLDVLEAEQDLLDAQIALARSQRDARVAAYSLLAAVGALNARQLDLDVQTYDLTGLYEQTENRWWGLQVAPAPGQSNDSSVTGGP